MYKHPFDPISFVFGLAFVALAAVFALPVDPWSIADLTLGWLWPLLVIAAGLALMAPALRRDNGSDTNADLDTSLD